MKLHLENKLVFQGESFGAEVDVSGEVVFSTGMVGYVESITDPSYAGQILVLTYPLIGNYGVPEKSRFESEKIQVAGLIVQNYSEDYSHYEAVQSLGAWLKKEKVPAMTGVDTRALTKLLREKGVMLGSIRTSGKPVFIDPNEENLVAKVSRRTKKAYGNGARHVILVDCGAKENIARSLAARGVRVTRVPWDFDFTRLDYDGVVFSNGPGDPTQCTATIENAKKAFQKGKPVLGICLGTQIMALAAGGKTFKLKYGHRSHNQPAIDADGKAYITSQNHGYAVDEKYLPKDWKVWFRNGNDNSVEGIRHAVKPFISVQFHPEATPGPNDTSWIFDEFITSLTRTR